MIIKNRSFWVVFCVAWSVWLLPSSLFAQKGEFTLRIVDEKTKRPLDCRLEIRSEKGVAKQAQDVPFLYDHNAVPGEATLYFPVGVYPMTIERGLEYLPRTGHFVLNRGAKDMKTVELRRFVDLSQKGWWSGDFCVLRREDELEQLMKSDDVHFVPRLSTQFATQTQETRFDLDRIRTEGDWFLDRDDCGVSLLNRTSELVPPFLATIDDARTPLLELYLLKKMEPDLWFDLHNADSWDVPLLAALGMLDSVQILGSRLLRDDMLPQVVDWGGLPKFKTARKTSDYFKEKEGAVENSGASLPSAMRFDRGIDPVRYRGARGRQRWTEDVYFHLLNTGRRLPPSAGSGSGLSPNPVGANRVYVWVDRNEYERTADDSEFESAGGNAGFNREMWWESFRSGAAFVTNGPLFDLRVDGELPGYIFEFEDEKPVALQASLTLSLRNQADYIEVIMNGKTLQSIPFRKYAESGSLPPIEITQSGWFLLRVVMRTEGGYCCAMSAPYYVRMGGKIGASSDSALFFLRWALARAKQLRESGAFEGENGKNLEKLCEFSVQYWRREYEKAREEASELE
ncbi:MAG: hypothetical protein Q4D38_10205 [Planctomycetia bacterium]|nr:hypothetical protein [Planctomycetia bacterium]